MVMKPFKGSNFLKGWFAGLLVGVRTAKSGITGFCFLLDS